ncbi:unnamed protein product [Toxocara canis]|uniref:Transposase n=1 Tax=Toxocara canis TaxID=6265 RepID=A0A183V076_TOXCA|nr:unnamed protein product [Toxocara canis]
MGSVISADTVIDENVCLRRFTGLQPITDNDPFWNQLLSFNLKIDAYNRFDIHSLLRQNPISVFGINIGI